MIAVSLFIIFALGAYAIAATYENGILASKLNEKQQPRYDELV